MAATSGLFPEIMENCADLILDIMEQEDKKTAKPATLSLVKKLYKNANPACAGGYTENGKYCISDGYTAIRLNNGNFDTIPTREPLQARTGVCRFSAGTAGNPGTVCRRIKAIYRGAQDRQKRARLHRSRRGIRRCGAAVGYRQGIPERYCILDT